MNSNAETDSVSWPDQIVRENLSAVEYSDTEMEYGT